MSSPAFPGIIDFNINHPALLVLAGNPGDYSGFSNTVTLVDPTRGLAYVGSHTGSSTTPLQFNGGLSVIYDINNVAGNRTLKVSQASNLEVIGAASNYYAGGGIKGWSNGFMFLSIGDSNAYFLRSQTGLGALINLATASPPQLIKVTAPAGETFLQAVGDLDGDGFEDGFIGSSANNKGWVVWGVNAPGFNANKIANSFTCADALTITGPAGSNFAWYANAIGRTRGNYPTLAIVSKATAPDFRGYIDLAFFDPAMRSRCTISAPFPSNYGARMTGNINQKLGNGGISSGKMVNKVYDDFVVKNLAGNSGKGETLLFAGGSTVGSTGTVDVTSTYCKILGNAETDASVIGAPVQAVKVFNLGDDYSAILDGSPGKSSGANTLAGEVNVLRPFPGFCPTGTLDLATMPADGAGRFTVKGPGTANGNFGLNLNAAAIKPNGVDTAIINGYAIPYQGANAGETFLAYFGASPKIQNNKLTIRRGTTVVLTANDLKINVNNYADPLLRIQLLNMQNGIASSYSFLQQQITNGEISITQDNSHQKLIYDVKAFAREGYAFDSAVSPANVTFIDPILAWVNCTIEYGENRVPLAIGPQNFAATVTQSGEMPYADPTVRFVASLQNVYISQSLNNTLVTAFNQSAVQNSQTPLLVAPLAGNVQAPAGTMRALWGDQIADCQVRGIRWRAPFFDKYTLQVGNSKTIIITPDMLHIIEVNTPPAMPEDGLTYAVDGTEGFDFVELGINDPLEFFSQGKMFDGRILMQIKDNYFNEQGLKLLAANLTALSKYARSLPKKIQVSLPTPAQQLSSTAAALVTAAEDSNGTYAGIAIGAVVLLIVGSHIYNQIAKYRSLNAIEAHFRKNKNNSDDAREQKFHELRRIVLREIFKEVRTTDWGTHIKEGEVEDYDTAVMLLLERLSVNRDTWENKSIKDKENLGKLLARVIYDKAKKHMACCNLPTAGGFLWQSMKLFFGSKPWLDPNWLAITRNRNVIANLAAHYDSNLKIAPGDGEDLENLDDLNTTYEGERKGTYKGTKSKSALRKLVEHNRAGSSSAVEVDNESSRNDRGRRRSESASKSKGAPEVSVINEAPDQPSRQATQRDYGKSPDIGSLSPLKKMGTNRSDIFDTKMEEEPSPNKSGGKNHVVQVELEPVTKKSSPASSKTATSKDSSDSEHSATQPGSRTASQIRTLGALHETPSILPNSTSALSSSSASSSSHADSGHSRSTSKKILSSMINRVDGAIDHLQHSKHSSLSEVSIAGAISLSPVAHGTSPSLSSIMLSSTSSSIATGSVSALATATAAASSESHSGNLLNLHQKQPSAEDASTLNDEHEGDDEDEEHQEGQSRQGSARNSVIDLRVVVPQVDQIVKEKLDKLKADVNAGILNTDDDDFDLPPQPANSSGDNKPKQSEQDEQILKMAQELEVDDRSTLDTSALQNAEHDKPQPRIINAGQSVLSPSGSMRAPFIATAYNSMKLPLPLSSETIPQPSSNSSAARVDDANLELFSPQVVHVDKEAAPLLSAAAVSSDSIALGLIQRESRESASSDNGNSSNPGSPRTSQSISPVSSQIFDVNNNKPEEKTPTSKTVIPSLPWKEDYWPVLINSPVELFNEAGVAKLIETYNAIPSQSLTRKLDNEMQMCAMIRMLLADEAYKPEFMKSEVNSVSGVQQARLKVKISAYEARKGKYEELFKTLVKHHRLPSEFAKNSTNSPSAVGGMNLGGVIRSQQDVRKELSKQESQLRQDKEKQEAAEYEKQKTPVSVKK